MSSSFPGYSWPPIEESTDTRLAGDRRDIEALKRKTPVNRGASLYQIKVDEDTVAATVRDNAFDWGLPKDLDGATLVGVEGFLSGASSSGPVQVQLHRYTPGGGGADLLTTKLTIDAGELNSKDSGTPVVIDPAVAVDFAWGDHIRIDCDAAGVNALGLNVETAWVPSTLAAVTVKGAKGDAGGVNNWRGSYSGSTSYSTGDAVSKDGTSYVATAPSTGVIPGVTPGWQSYWMVLAGAQQISELVFSIDGANYPIDPGLKGFLPVYFPCTIVEATLLADRVGSIVIEVWKDTYGAYPPTSGDKITASAPPTLSSGDHTTDTALTGWTTAIAAGDVLAFNVVSCSLITRAFLSLKVLRS